MMTISYQALAEFSQHLFVVDEGGVQERVPGPLLLRLDHQLRHRGVSDPVHYQQQEPRPHEDHLLRPRCRRCSGLVLH